MKLEDTYEISKQLIVDFMGLIKYVKEAHNLNYNYFWGDYCEKNYDIFNGQTEDANWVLEKLEEMSEYSDAKISKFASKMYDELDGVFERFKDDEVLDIVVRYSW